DAAVGVLVREALELGRGHELVVVVRFRRGGRGRKERADREEGRGRARPEARKSPHDLPPGPPRGGAGREGSRNPAAAPSRETDVATPFTTTISDDTQRPEVSPDVQ